MKYGNIKFPIFSISLSQYNSKSIDYKKETSVFQKRIDQKINLLKPGILSAEKSIKSSNYKNSQAKEEVKKRRLLCGG